MIATIEYQIAAAAGIALLAGFAAAVPAPDRSTISMPRPRTKAHSRSMSAGRLRHGEARAEVDFEERFPGIKITIDGGFSNVLDKKVDAQLAAGKLEVDAVMQQIRPHPAARIGGRASRTRRTDVIRLALSAATVRRLRGRGRAGRRTAGVGHQDVEPPKRASAASTRRAGSAGSVTSPDRVAASPPSSTTALRATSSASSSPRDENPHPFGGQGHRRCPTQSLRARGDQGHLALDAEIHAPPQASTTTRSWSTVLSGSGAVLADHHDVLEAHPEAVRQVDAGLDREGVARVAGPRGCPPPGRGPRAPRCRCRARCGG